MERRNATCGAKTGLLFLKDCGRIPREECTQCSRPICREPEPMAYPLMAAMVGFSKRMILREASWSSSRYSR